MTLYTCCRHCVPASPHHPPYTKPIAPFIASISWSRVGGRAVMALPCAAAAGAAIAVPAQAKRYDPGASDTEIKIGQTMPYSGPASAYGSQGKTTLAYFKMLNAKGGINGRPIKLVVEDDASNPDTALSKANDLLFSLASRHRDCGASVEFVSSIDAKLGRAHQQTV